MTMAIQSVLLPLVLVWIGIFETVFAERAVHFLRLGPGDGNQTEKCTPQNTRLRKEWRFLSRNDRLDYIKAVQCLHESPSKTQKYFPAAQNRYDDFVALHVNATNGGIHNVGVFLPWHRLTIWTYETVLRNECNYTGAQPYWDYTLDTPEHGGHFENSPLFDSIYGFGSTKGATVVPPPLPVAPAQNSSRPKSAGQAGGPMGWMVAGSCVVNGPFAKYSVNLGPGNNSQKANPRCLTRNLNGPAAERGAAQKNIDALMARSTFEKFQTLDGNPEPLAVTSFAQFTPGVHSIGHMGIGGEMTNPWTSTNDPLFWMHHTELDRLWANWQGSNQTRLNDLAAPVGLSFRAMLDKAAPVARTNKDSMIWMGQFPPSLPIGKIADTQNRDGQGVLCYRYEG